MEDVVSFCDKTIKKTNIKIDQTEGILKQQFRKNEYDGMQKTIKANKASMKKMLPQGKFKKFNILKYISKMQIKATTIEETESRVKSA